MKLSLLSTLGVAFTVALSAAESTNNTTSAQMSPEDRISYALGINIGSNFKNRGVEVNSQVFLNGVNDAISGKKPLLSEQEIQATFKELNDSMRVKAEEKAKLGKAEGEKFLAENAKKEGIQKTESGLQYKVIKEGTGNPPGPTDRVTVLYTGKLIDGTVFDSTDKRNGTPAVFPVNGVIRGWTEGLQKMKPGSKYQFFIPSDLAYGERGTPGIPGNSTLIFDVELVKVEPAPAPKAPEPVTSDIIKVPSAEELKKGAKIEVLKPEDVKRLQEEQKKQGQNPSSSNPNAPKK
ncbi:MAG: FKBP-type peptidyl-prolyl cis-trans isomerase N-terminal domain-containing protein [Verrucomicrobiales bacterium]